MCPEHELELVPIDKLKSRGEHVPDEREPVPPWDLRFGRGLVLAAAVLLLVAPGLPFLSLRSGERAETVTAYELAIERAAHNLWIIPCVAFGLFVIILRRRSPLTMRGARVAVPVLALMVPASVAMTVWRVQQGTSEVAARGGPAVSLHIQWGVGVLAVATLLALIGGIRLGVVRSAR